MSLWESNPPLCIQRRHQHNTLQRQCSQSHQEQTEGSALPSLPSWSHLPYPHPFLSLLTTQLHSPEPLRQCPPPSSKGGGVRRGQQQAQPTSLKASFDRGRGTSGLGFQFNSTMIYCGPASCRGSGLGQAGRDAEISKVSSVP